MKADTNAFTTIKRTDGVVKGQVAGNASAYRQDHKEGAPFAPLRQNNKVKCYTAGNDYFQDVYAAMKAATKSIFIAGWQVNWDVELIPGERLIDVLHNRVQSSESFRVFVMPWMSPKVGVNTHDLDTMLAIFQLNAGRKTVQAMCCPAGAQNDFTGVEGAYFSHHQKLVVIDNEIAFVGGLDLAYGRCDDNTFSLDVSKKRYNERYNPGMPATVALNPENDFECLSAMELLSTTLSAGRWNAGGDSEESALVAFLKRSIAVADQAAIEAVMLVNKGAKLALKGARTAAFAPAHGTAYTAQKAAAAGNTAIHTSADIAVAASRAVSQQCAAIQVPDLYGGVQQFKVGATPTSSVPGSIRQLERDTRQNVNTAIDTVAGWADFLSPVKRLRVSPEPQSSLPDVIARGERAARRGINTVVDVAAATAGGVQTAAEGAREVCVEIAPAVAQGATQAKAAGNNLQRSANQLAQGVRDIEQATVNAFQQAVVSQIGSVRRMINETLLSVKGVGNQAVDNILASDGVTPANIQSVIDGLKRMLKLIYLSQLAVSWIDIKQHPLLLIKSVKAAPTGGMIIGNHQPRQPWQDVHARLQGPAVYDLAMNFIGRWNATHESYLSDTTLGDAGALVGKAFGSVVGGGRLLSLAGNAAGRALGSKARSAVMIQDSLIPAEPPKSSAPSDSAVRVLRSASIKLQKQEASAMQRGKATIPGPQSEIQAQMVNLITNATDFIYIENQFFQSGFGMPSIDVFSDAGAQRVSAPMRYLMSQRGNSVVAQLTTFSNPPNAKALPRNAICETLGWRIEQAARHGWPFHVFMVLPVHPEGRLDDITVIAQIHWTMQSLVFADHSLVNRVRRAVAAAKICKNPISDAAWTDAMVEAGKGFIPAYESVTEDEWGKYLTLLNLRACEMIAGKARTEQIYIHSKLLIADDRHMIIGSANINDRSQNGDRDSELAVLVMDDTNRETVVLRDQPTPVHHVVRKARMDLWKKHLALAGANGLVQPASAMSSLIEKPAAAATISAIRNIAAQNAKTYQSAFPFTPWSEGDMGTARGASLWPVCPRGSDTGQVETLAAKMPFHEAFWGSDGPTSNPPSGIQGHFVKLPNFWTLGENNHPSKMSVMAVAKADTKSAPSSLSNPQIA